MGTAPIMAGPDRSMHHHIVLHCYCVFFLFSGHGSKRDKNKDTSSPSATVSTEKSAAKAKSGEYYGRFICRA